MGTIAYELATLITGRTLHRHISQLKEFDSSRCSPQEVATRNTPDYLVEQIVSHTGTKANRPRMRFRVRWLSYGPDDDTMEPWKNLKNNWVFHQYCREQGLEDLIPTAFQDVVLQPFK